MLQQMGVKDVQMEELFDLSLLDSLKPVYGLLFLFKYVPSEPKQIDENAPVFFAKQVINNACATQALLSVLMNQDDNIEIGPLLSQFKEFTAELPADIRGLAISNSEEIRDIHNSFSRADPFSIEQTEKDAGDEDVYHFIAYIQKNGCIYELDGLQRGPINHGPCKPDEFCTKIQPVIQQRIAQYQNSEIGFNLMAMVKSRLSIYKEQLSQAKTEVEKSELQMLVLNEEAKWKQWSKENTRRRANYLGFTFTLLRMMAEKKTLKV